MSRVILLDAGPLAVVANPQPTRRTLPCMQWFQSHVAAGSRLVLPEITDYEVRRELLRLQRPQSIQRLDYLAATLDYLPLTTAAMRQAAVLWAAARHQGQPMAGDDTIDCDMILLAQAQTMGVAQVIIATTNVGHLQRFLSADLWQNIVP